MRPILFLLSLITYLTSHGQCDSSMWKHVYNIHHLLVEKKCITVAGIVKKVKREKDGDYHIRLKIMGNQDSLLNSKNISEQDTCLVVEIICACEVKQQDAVSACNGYVNTLRIPRKGERIRVTGVYVLDNEHGWMEIHPVTSIVRVYPADF